MSMIKKKMITRLMKGFLMFAVFVAVSFHFTEISRADSQATGLVITAVSNDKENYDDASSGIVMEWKGITYIVSGNLDDGTYYYFGYRDKLYAMEQCDTPLGADDGLQWFTASDIDFTPPSVVQGSLHSEYTLHWYNYNEDKELETQSDTLTISNVENVGNIYAGSLSTEFEDGMLPVIITDADGGVIGYLPSKSYFVMLEEPIGYESAETESSTETENESSGVTEPQDSGVSAETESESSGESVTSVEEDNDNNHSGILIIIFCGALGAAIGGYLVFKKKKNQPSKNMPSEQIFVQNPTPIVPRQDSTPVIKVESPAFDPIKPSEVTPVPAPVPTPLPQMDDDLKNKWFIEIDGGSMNGFIYPVNNGILIGRGSECNVQYPADAKGISHGHCKIFVNNNSLFVMDMHSTSGTFLKGVGQLEPNVPKQLQANDVIYLAEKKNAIIIRYNQ